ncbi:MAG: hypothetical protein HY047_07525 [Acidobacteria bacterium]|nr:hypothetical protein [Acidobacteriota bacterium]
MLVFLFPSLAAAQSAGSNGRFRISLNGGEQISGDVITQSFTVQKNLEAAPITVDVDNKRGQWFDGGIVAGVKGRLGVGVAVSYAWHDTNAGVAASIAHPFFFNQPRPIAGTAGTTRTETAVHVDAVYFLRRGTLDVSVSGGPSFFSARQTLVTDVTYTDAYPFDTATFASASTTRSSTTAAGFNVGAEATWMRWRRVGVGGLVRFARASTTFSVASNNTATGDLGGLQVGGGLRFAF